MPNKSSPKCSTSDATRLIENVLSSQEFLKKLAAAVSKEIDAKITALTDRYEKKLEEKQQKIDALQQELMDRSDELEQYQRRNSIRIFGKEEKSGEDTDCIAIAVAQQLGINLEISDIDRSHRVGPKAAGKKRPIIVKFVSYRKRREIFAAKRKLAGSGVTIREDLTRQRLQVLREAVQKFGLENVWTMDGTVIIKIGNNKVRVKSLLQLNAVNS